MNKIYYLIITCLLTQNIIAQRLVSYREAPLMDNGYEITGKAIIELYDNGDTKLRLDEDFTTEDGPDVQIYLSTSTSPSGIVVADIGSGSQGGSTGISHFAGAISFDLPSGTQIENYSHVVFHCVFFNASWALGELGDVVNSNVTSIDDPNANQQFQFYPNPANDQIAFNSEIAQLSIFNSEGLRVKRASNVSSLETSDLANGVYILDLDNEKIKLVVNH